MKAAAAAMATVLLFAAACTSGGNGDTASGLPVIVQGYDDPSLPYGIVAIDYHFHDAHPSIPLDPSRDVTFSNQGSSTSPSLAVERVSGLRLLVRRVLRE